MPGSSLLEVDDQESGKFNAALSGCLFVMQYKIDRVSLSESVESPTCTGASRELLPPAFAFAADVCHPNNRLSASNINLFPP